MTGMDRRRMLALMAAGGLGAACAHDSEAPDANSAASGIFRHGVASGDPDQTSLVIWTRLSVSSGRAEFTWLVSEDPGFRQVLVRGQGETSEARDWTVKVLVTGLQPGRVFYYRFASAGEVSPVGRTRTLPEGSTDQLGIALASCSNYAFGFFNAYDAIARDKGIDFVLHTGDYIYEYGGEGSWGEAQASLLGRRHDPPSEIVTLSDYRRRHAQYKSDSGSQAMHAAHPLLCCWDDHESTNNPWVGGAENHQSETEGSWPQRRAVSVQAYYEWMPVRDPAPGHDPLAFWRTYRFGDLATLVTLETRHTARSEQVDYDAWKDRLQTKADYDYFRQAVIGAPDRVMLSPAMEAEIVRAMRQSIDMEQPWRLIGNPIPIARMLVPDLVALGVLPPPDGTSPDAHRRLAWLGRHALPFYTDTWDGYPAAREKLYTLCRSAGAADLLFLTGDSHSFWVNQLKDEAGSAIGIELGTAGITSPGDFVESGFPEAQAKALDAAFASYLDEVVWTDNFHQGYVRVSLSRDMVRADFMAVRTVLAPDAGISRIHTVDIARTDQGIELLPSKP